MNQISEFSLILCTLCVRSGVLDPIVLTVMTLAAVLSIIVSSIGHIFVEQLYAKAKAGLCSRCMACIDAHYREQHHHHATDKLPGGASDENTAANGSGGGIAANQVELVNETPSKRQQQPHAEAGAAAEGRTRAISLAMAPPPGWMSEEGDDAWSFEAQLKDRSTEQLKLDVKKVEKELEDAREAMSVTAEEKKKHHGRVSLYAKATSKAQQASRTGNSVNHGKMATSHAIDIVHGLIEGYVVVGRKLMFCTLRSGRMLFWEDQHDVGHTPPSSVWDVSGMAMMDMDMERQRKLKRDRIKKLRKSRSGDLLRGVSVPFMAGKNKNKEEEEEEEEEETKEVAGGDAGKEDENRLHGLSDLATVEIEDDYESSDQEDDEEEIHPWEWTIVLAHLHRTAHAVETGADPMKLRFHGLEDHSDHDLQDWQDALSVVSMTLNPIALRRAHIKEELTIRRRKLMAVASAAASTAGEVDAEAIQSRQRADSIVGRMEVHDHRDQIICLGYNEMFPAVLSLADATNKEVVVVEYDPQKINAVKAQYNVVRRNQASEEKKNTAPKNADRVAANYNDSNTGPLKGVQCVYADIHDPESWEELEMDEAFMIICTMKGARHAEKAICKWLKKHNSETIFIACTTNNIEAQKLYSCGAHFVMQTDALAMRATREIFMETVANVGDCSQLVIAGAAHASRLKKLKSTLPLKFLYETG